MAQGTCFCTLSVFEKQSDNFFFQNEGCLLKLTVKISLHAFHAFTKEILVLYENTRT